MKTTGFMAIFIIAAFICQLFLSWWIIAIVAFIICYIFKPGKFPAFSGCLLAGFLLWIAKSYYADLHADIPISSLLGGLLGDVSTSAIYFLTGSIGGIIAGLGGLLGDWTRNLFQKQSLKTL